MVLALFIDDTQLLAEPMWRALRGLPAAIKRASVACYSRAKCLEPGRSVYGS